MLDQTIPDEQWWFATYAEFEDFVGISPDRVRHLVQALQGKVSSYELNRLLEANNLPHGPTNSAELMRGGVNA